MGGRHSKNDANLHTVCLFRHGARAPTANALACFEGTDTGDAWDSKELGVLTTVGVKQSKNLGEHVAKRLHALAKSGGTKPFTRASWVSSISERARLSGFAFVEGFTKTVRGAGLQFDVSNLEEPIEVKNSDDLFRPWKTKSGYMGNSQKLKQGTDEVFSAKAMKERKFLLRMRQYMSAECAQQELSDTLYRMTYFVEVMECEEHLAESETRSNLRSKISKRDRAKIEELAIWVWNYRFFRMGESRSLGRGMYERVLENAVENEMNLFSAHDYTILVILSYLGVSEYPKTPLGFSSYVTIRVDPKRKEIKDIKLNSCPYTPESKTNVVGKEVKVRW